MANRLIKVLADNKYLVQGVSRVSGARFQATQADGDTLTYRVDFKRWLSGATLASREVTASSLTASSTLGTTYVDLEVSDVSSSGKIIVAVVSSNGLAKEIELFVATSPTAQPDGKKYTAFGDLAYHDRLPISLIDTITISEDDPSGGSDGDIWFKVAPA